MRDSYYLKCIDSLGRIVIPKKFRDKLDLKFGDHLSISMDNNVLVMKKHCPSCVFCNSSNDIINYKGKNICRKCQNEISKLFKG